MQKANPFPEFRHQNTASVMNKAKKSHRTDFTLNDWTKCGYATDNTIKRLAKLEETSVRLASVDASSTTPEQLYQDYLLKGIPVIIRNAVNHWPAIKDGRWSIDSLLPRFKHAMFKVGEDDDGRKIKAKVKYFIDYMQRNQDDSPLYLFESGLDTTPEGASLLEDYSIPAYFPHDYLNLCGRENKPPFRWWSIGPKRSGTTVHKDPLGTNAWNAVTCGRKRWILFEPSVPRPIARGKKYRLKGEDDEAIHYFDYLLPRIINGNPAIKAYETIQEPGDIIFVPGGWWHGVLNLDDCVAVTQNYCGPENFDFVWTRMNRDRPGLCERWERNLKKWAPPLYKRIKTHLRRNNEDMFPHGETSEDSSSSSESEYSTDDEECDIDWNGLHAPRT